MADYLLEKISRLSFLRAKKEGENQMRITKKKRSNEKGITLIALVITIVILIILATISVNIVMNGGLINRTEIGTDLHKMQAAREKLELTLGNAQIEKIVNNEYDEKEFLNEFIAKEIKEVLIIDDIVDVEGYSFSIDRSVPKIGEYLGKLGEEDKDIKIVGSITETDNDTKAKLHIEITYEGEISEIIIKGERIEVPTPVNGVYSFDKEVTENGTYIVIAKDKEGNYKTEKIEITNLAENMDIWNKADLEKFRDLVNGGKTFAGRTIKVMDDIDLENVAWTPIANYATNSALRIWRNV